MLHYYLAQDNYNQETQKLELSSKLESYEADKKETQNQLLLKDKEVKEGTIKNQKWLLGLSLLFLSLLSFLAYTINKQRKHQVILNEELSKQKAQIQVLNQEVNHRVKNNLAFMTSLLEMQARRTDNIETKQLLKESESRLKTLSLVHANLFNKADTTNLNLNVYLSQIVQHLQQYYALPDKVLHFNINFINNEVEAEDAMRLGLIVNELVTNSVKHAFTNISNPTIDISTTQDKSGKIYLEYKDNGPGITDKNDRNQAMKETSLGTKLIELLTKQLDEKYIITSR
jgi:two-component system, sensor histidine kinase PdtaS